MVVVNAEPGRHVASSRLTDALPIHALRKRTRMMIASRITAPTRERSGAVRICARSIAAGHDMGVLTDWCCRVKRFSGIALFVLVLLGGNRVQSQWIRADSGLATPWVRTLMKSGPYLFAATSNGVYRSDTNGSLWNRLELDSANVNASLIVCFTVHDNVIFAGTAGGVYRSTDSGASWTEGDNGLTDHSVTALVASGPTLLVGTFHRGVFRSTDDGQTWTSAGSGMTNHQVSGLALSGSALLAGTNAGIYGGGVFRSTDNGSSWTAADSGLVEISDPVNVFFISASSTDSFLGIGEPFVLHSGDGGTTWSLFSIERLFAYSAVAIAGNWFVGGASAIDQSNAIYRSTDKGDNWSRVDDGILSPERSQNFVSAFVVSGENLFISIEGAGIYRRPLNEMVTAVKPGPLLETGWALSQNYPNPFNPTTVISGQWTVDSKVRLVVYDILGREVAVLADGRYPAGKYTFTFDGSPFSSGTYFYRLTAGSYTAVRKMSLIK